MENIYIWLTIVLAVLSYILVIVTRWVYARRKKQQLFKKMGIPGPEPSFFGGNLREMKASSVSTDALSRWLKQYGDIFGYYIGEDPYLVIKDLDMLKLVAITDFQSFYARPAIFVQTKPLSTSILALEGKKWKQVRSILSPTFSSRKIKNMSLAVDRKVSIMLKLVNEKTKSGEMFDIYEDFRRLTLDIIAHCALAMDVQCQENSNDILLRAVKSFFLTLNNELIDLAVYFPFIVRFITFLNKFITFGKMTSMIMKNVKEAINNRRANPDSRRPDLLQLMLDAAESCEETLSERRKTALISDDEIVANAFAFLLAGYEKTSTALAFTFHLLVQHPEVQEKLYEEIKEKLPEGPCSFEDVQKLRYLDQVLNESLRMYPPVIGFITRKCVQECRVGDILVPEGVVVQAPVWDIHHDPELWPDPWKFDPDRFSAENKGEIHNLSFMPFGIGPRNCIGMRFAQLEAKLAISRLIQNFRFIPCEKTEIPLKIFSPAVQINPANGIFLKAVCRDT